MWAEHEAGDWLQTDAYFGGFDADELAFCFSWFRGGAPEVRFQFSLAEAEAIANGQETRIEGRLAD